jgi:hypothetical protein
MSSKTTKVTSTILTLAPFSGGDTQWMHTPKQDARTMQCKQACRKGEQNLRYGYNFFQLNKLGPYGRD